jgi:hypothetical protein
VLEEREPLAGLTTSSVRDLLVNRDAEWNQLIYRVSDSTEFDSVEPRPKPWVRYTYQDLDLGQFCATTALTDSLGTNAALRGSGTVAYITTRLRTLGVGWRPVLEVLTGLELFKSINLTYRAVDGLITPGGLEGTFSNYPGLNLAPGGVTVLVSGEELLRPYGLRYELESNLIPLSDPVSGFLPARYEYSYPGAVQATAVGEDLLRTASLYYLAQSQVFPIGDVEVKTTPKLIAPGGLQVTVTEN